MESARHNVTGAAMTCFSDAQASLSLLLSKFSRGNKEAVVSALQWRERDDKDTGRGAKQERGKKKESEKRKLRCGRPLLPSLAAVQLL